MAKTMCDADIDRLVAMGDIRSDNENAVDAPVFIPPPPAWAKDRAQFCIAQRKVLGPQALTNHYMELLVRATALLEFMHHNVGISDEWPLTIMGDSEEVEECFGELIGRLESAVGCLTEV